MSSGIDGITAIIAAYNAQNTIGRAISSALSQKAVAEILVVDDASTDKTTDAAMYYANNSSKIRLIMKSRNHGPATCRNMAIDLCKTPFFAILDADDKFLPDRFDGIKDDGWDFFCDNIIFLPDGTGENVKSLLPSHQIHMERQLSLDEFLVSNTGEPDKAGIELGFMKPIVRRSTIKRLGLSYDETLRLGEDYLFYAQALARGARVRLSSGYGYVAHVSNTSLSRCHTTRDLEALTQADDRLIEALSASGASAATIGLLRQHRAAIARKIRNRRFLDDRKRFGAFRALAAQARHPRRLAGIVADILSDRRRHQDVTTQPRSLFDQREFARRAEYARCS